MTHDDYMRLAVRVAEQGIAAGQTPFGAVIVRDGQLVSEGHNSVWLTGDPTAHAEVVAIRKAADQFEGATSSEPWSRPSGIGRGSSGAYPEWSSLKSTLTGILNNTAQELDRAADHLEIVANDFEKTDAQIQADLEAHTAQVTKEDEVHLAPSGGGGHHPI